MDKMTDDDDVPATSTTTTSLDPSRSTIQESSMAMAMEAESARRPRAANTGGGGRGSGGAAAAAPLDIGGPFRGGYKPWSQEEDDLLRALVEQHGANTWPVIAGHLPGRTSKSCRLRWVNQLRDDLRSGPFTAAEDDRIVQLQAVHGNKWSTIAQELPGRTDNMVKNRWNSYLKKRIDTGIAIAASVAMAASLAAVSGGSAASGPMAVQAQGMPTGADASAQQLQQQQHYLAWQQQLAVLQQHPGLMAALLHQHHQQQEQARQQQEAAAAHQQQAAAAQQQQQQQMAAVSPASQADAGSLQLQQQLTGLNLQQQQYMQQAPGAATSASPVGAMAGTSSAQSPHLPAGGVPEQHFGLGSSSGPTEVPPWLASAPALQRAGQLGDPFLGGGGALVPQAAAGALAAAQLLGQGAALQPEGALVPDPRVTAKRARMSPGGSTAAPDDAGGGVPMSGVSASGRPRRSIAEKPRAAAGAAGRRSSGRRSVEADSPRQPSSQRSSGTAAAQRRSVSGAVKAEPQDDPMQSGLSQGAAAAAGADVRAAGPAQLHSPHASYAAYPHALGVAAAGPMQHLGYQLGTDVPMNQLGGGAWPPALPMQQLPQQVAGLPLAPQHGGPPAPAHGAAAAGAAPMAMPITFPNPQALALHLVGLGFDLMTAQAIATAHYGRLTPPVPAAGVHHHPVAHGHGAPSHHHHQQQQQQLGAAGSAAAAQASAVAAAAGVFGHPGALPDPLTALPVAAGSGAHGAGLPSAWSPGSFGGGPGYDPFASLFGSIASMHGMHHQVTGATPSELSPLTGSMSDLVAAGMEGGNESADWHLARLSRMSNDFAPVQAQAGLPGGSGEEKRAGSSPPS